MSHREVKVRLRIIGGASTLGLEFDVDSLLITENLMQLHIGTMSEDIAIHDMRYA